MKKKKKDGNIKVDVEFQCTFPFLLCVAKQGFPSRDGKVNIFHRKECEPNCLGLKLDMSKAYDRMEWDFIEETVGVLGFHGEFISIIRECIS